MTEAKPPLCFLVSPIGESGSETRRAADDFREFIVNRCEAIQEYKYKVLRADDIHEPGRITSQVIRKIVESDLVIADVTGANPNVYYELAIRHAIGKAFITCAHAGTVLPFDTRDNRTIFYSMHSRDAENARIELAEQVRVIQSGNFRPDSPVSEAQQVITILNSPGDSGNEFAKILEAMDALSGRMGSIEQQMRRRTITVAADPVVPINALARVGNDLERVIASVAVGKSGDPNADFRNRLASALLDKAKVSANPNKTEADE